VLSRVAYEIDVYGAMAVGRLIHEFTNGSELELSLVYSCEFQRTSPFGPIEMESQGRLHELQAEVRSAATNVGKTTGKSRQRTSAAGDRGAAVQKLRREFPQLASQLGYSTTERGETEPGGSIRSEPFEIEGGQIVSVHSSYRAPLLVDGRLFRLTLPAIREAARPQAAADPDRAAFVPMRIEVTVHHDERLLELRSASHEILSDFLGDRTIVEPTLREVPADQPFELEFAVNSKAQPTVAGYVREDAEGRLGIEAVLTPPEAPNKDTARPKQVLFIMDSSGSMSKEEKLVQARSAVSACVKKLLPVDKFNVAEFDTDVKMFRPAPVEPGELGEDEVDEWLDLVAAEGGTQLLPALEAAFDQPDDPERHRIIIVVTDGILADETAALKLLDERLGNARLFVVGTGELLRQATLLRLAQHGRGAATFAGMSDELEPAVAALFDSISQPLGWDLQLDWDGAEIEEIVPTRLPDLYAGRPVRVLAWVRGDLPDTLALRMSTTDGERRLRVKLPPIHR
jgi:Ca-activated chloride channel family protein